MTHPREAEHGTEQKAAENLVKNLRAIGTNLFDDDEELVAAAFASYAKSVTLKLAEEAEQEADVHANSVGPQSGYQERMAKCRNAKIAAAWLREKAR